MNQLRIIAGKWRGRKINFPDQEGLRPTPDRIRETLFNWLQGEISGAHCLDLFAGSAALGIEAVSRGAASVLCVDASPKVVASIRDNLKSLTDAQMSVLQADALHYLQSASPSQPMDIVFLDPPFSMGLLAPACEALEQHDWLAPQAVIYLESAEPLEAVSLPPGWQLLKQKQAGQVFYGLCRRQE